MSIIIRHFHKNTVPQTYMRQIDNEDHWEHMCRGSVNWNTDGFSAAAIKDAQIIILALKKSPKGRSRKPMTVVAFLFGFDSSFKTDLDGKSKPVCKPYEWYLNVVCGDPKYKGIGRRVIEYFYQKAQRNHKTAIRLYSVKEAFDFWKKQGFKECETTCTDTCKHKRKRYKNDKTAVRMVKCL